MEILRWLCPVHHGWTWWWCISSIIHISEEKRTAAFERSLSLCDNVEFFEGITISNVIAREEEYSSPDIRDD